MAFFFLPLELGSEFGQFRPQLSLSARNYLSALCSSLGGAMNLVNREMTAIAGGSKKGCPFIGHPKLTKFLK